MINQIEDQVEDEAQTLGAKVQQKSQEFQQAALDWQRRASESAKRAFQATDSYVHDNPWSVIGSVALGFFALGFLLGRSRE